MATRYSISRSRPSGTWERMPGTSAHSATAGHHEAALGVTADGRGRPAAGSEHPFEFPLRQLGRSAEVLDDADDAAADGDVAHHLGGPGVDLGVGLLREAGAVLGAVG